jgi:hypothetical protein
MDLEISKRHADYMYNLVERIVENVGPRMLITYGGGLKL